MRHKPTTFWLWSNMLTIWLKAQAASQQASSLRILIGVLQNTVCHTIKQFGLLFIWCGDVILRIYYDKKVKNILDFVDTHSVVLLVFFLFHLQICMFVNCLSIYKFANCCQYNTCLSLHLLSWLKIEKYVINFGGHSCPRYLTTYLYDMTYLVYVDCAIIFSIFVYYLLL